MNINKDEANNNNNNHTTTTRERWRDCTRTHAHNK